MPFSLLGGLGVEKSECYLLVAGVTLVKSPRTHLASKQALIGVSSASISVANQAKIEANKC